MVDGTIRGMLEGKETITRTLEPCDLVFVLGIRREDESHTACQQVMLGGKGVNTLSAVDALADSANGFLIELSDGSRKQNAVILAAYMKAFINHAVDKNGMAVMDAITKIVKSWN